MLVDCVNCGKQAECDTYDDTCYWCGKPVRKKVKDIAEIAPTSLPPIAEATEKMASGEKSSKEVAMRKGGNFYAKHRLIEEHKAEIIADFVSLGKKVMLKKWDISGSSWSTIKKRWKGDIEAAGGSIAKQLRVPSIGDKRRKGYKAEGWTEPVNGREYAELAARFDGYRQAVLDIFGNVESDSKKE